jgi:hypothetical protein
VFRLSQAHTSYGGGLRMGMTPLAAMRVEIAKGVEGVHATFTLGSDF